MNESVVSEPYVPPKLEIGNEVLFYNDPSQRDQTPSTAKVLEVRGRGVTLKVTHRNGAESVRKGCIYINDPDLKLHPDRYSRFQDGNSGCYDLSPVTNFFVNGMKRLDALESRVAAMQEMLNILMRVPGDALVRRGPGRPPKSAQVEQEAVV